MIHNVEIEIEIVCIITGYLKKTVFTHRTGDSNVQLIFPIRDNHACECYNVVFGQCESF